MNSLYSNTAYTVHQWDTWYVRGGALDTGIQSGAFSGASWTGMSYDWISFRTVLTP